MTARWTGARADGRCSTGGTNGSGSSRPSSRSTASGRRGGGKVWIFNGEATDPSEVEAIGMTFLRTRQDHWKPTGRAVSRFGAHATKNVIELDPEQAVTFAAGEDQDLPRSGMATGDT